MEIIAHRGASHDAPENTLAAFKLGWQQGADAVELDIWLTKDGKIICLHDEDTERTTGVAGKVGEKTLAELRAMDAGSWKGAEWKGERLPTLAEALAAIPAGRRLVIEIKGGADVLPELERDLKAAGTPENQLLIISFKLDVCSRAKALFPRIPVLLLSGFKQDQDTQAWSPTADELVRKAKEAKLDGVNVSFKGPVDAEFVRTVRAAGLKVYAWTVNDAAAARKLAAAGIDGLTTDRPEWLRRQLR